MTDYQRGVNGGDVITVLEPVPVPPFVPTGLATTDDLNAAVATLNAAIAAVHGDIPRVAYSHLQEVASTTWTITHNLGYYPGGIVVQDSDGNVIESDISYIDLNTVQLTHAAPIGGSAKVS